MSKVRKNKSGRYNFSGGMSVCVARYDFDYDFCPSLCSRFDEMKRYVARNTCYAFFSNGNLSKHSECFGKILVVNIWQHTRLVVMHTPIIDMISFITIRTIARVF